MATQENNILSDPGDKLFQQQEVSDLKLQLNASQQTIASLELKIRQKEEIIIKTQADTIKQAQAYKTEVKKLKDQLKETSKIIENSSTSELQEALKVAEGKEKKAVAELQEKIQKEQELNKILQGFEKTVAANAAEYNKLNDLHEQVKVNLTTLEMAFHDVIQKYERAKTVIEGFKANEAVFKESIEAMEKNLKLEAERYESLKTHAKTQIEKANKENNLLKSQSDQLEIKQHAIIKRLEIKSASLENALEQKTKECSELAALCDEVTGKRV